MVRKLLSVEQAAQCILEASREGQVVRMPLADALGCVLAEDLTTSSDSPRFDKAMMDGFAICTGEPEVPAPGENPANETASATPVAIRKLRVVETVTAGSVPSCRVTPETAVRIMTGAEVPPGANCVVPIEQTAFDESQPGEVSIPEAVVRAESCIVRQGGIVRAGAALLSAGSRIYPAQIAALAEFGFAHVPVFRVPSVAVLATGDELVAVDQQPDRSQIRNTNAPMLQAQIRQCGAHAVPLGIARDTTEDLRQHIQQGLQSDILLLTGGVSAGTLDLVPAQLAAAGVRQIFHGVLMKPGKPLWFGVFEAADHRCLVFGLPGNPVSSLVCFELFVRIAINRLSGRPQPIPVPFPGVLTEDVTITGNRPVFHPVRVRLMPSGLCVKPVPWSGSSDLHATIEANAMVHLQCPPGNYRAGDVVDTWLWSDTTLQDSR